MRLSYCFVPVFAGLVLAGAAQAQTKPVEQAVNSSQVRQGSSLLSRHDQAFLRCVAQGADYEMTLAQLGQQQGESQAIKEYSQNIIKAYQSLSQSLRQIAEKKGLELPMTMTKAQEEKVGRLRALSGTSFDQAYRKSYQYKQQRQKRRA